jgi:hypothetical protein
VDHRGAETPCGTSVAPGRRMNANDARRVRRASSGPLKRAHVLSVLVVAALAAQASACSSSKTQAPPSSEVGPEGGTLTFAGGVKLVFPPGAVDTSTAITIDSLPAAPIDAILSPPSLVSNRTKRFLGGFSAKPDGLSFKVPVQAWIPISTLAPHESPIEVDVQQSSGTYRFIPFRLTYDGAEHMVEVDIQHFSSIVIAALSGPQIEALCTSCDSFSDPACAAVDPAQGACCLLYPSVRASCAAAAPCDCCKEKRITVTTVDTDISKESNGQNCTIVTSKVTIDFLDCPTSPSGPPLIESDSIEESEGCCGSVPLATGNQCCSDQTQGPSCCGTTVLAAGNQCCANGTQGPSCCGSKALLAGNQCCTRSQFPSTYACCRGPDTDGKYKACPPGSACSAPMTCSDGVRHNYCCGANAP